MYRLCAAVASLTAVASAATIRRKAFLEQVPVPTVAPTVAPTYPPTTPAPVLPPFAAVGGAIAATPPPMPTAVPGTTPTLTTTPYLVKPSAQSPVDQFMLPSSIANDPRMAPLESQDTSKMSAQDMYPQMPAEMAAKKFGKDNANWNAGAGIPTPNPMNRYEVRIDGDTKYSRTKLAMWSDKFAQKAIQLTAAAMKSVVKAKVEEIVKTELNKKFPETATPIGGVGILPAGSAAGSSPGSAVAPVTAAPAPVPVASMPGSAPGSNALPMATPVGSTGSAPQKLGPVVVVVKNSNDKPLLNRPMPGWQKVQSFGINDLYPMYTPVDSAQGTAPKVGSALPAVAGSSTGVAAVAQPVAVAPVAR